jgi:replicative DNA helicase
VADDLFSVGQALDDADAVLRSGHRAASPAISTGFGLLDTYLGGGLRGGELCLLAGPQGSGKTALVLQIARQAASVDDSAVVMSYEHDATTLLERLITIEAGEAHGVDGTPLRRVRDALEGAGPRLASLAERLDPTTGGAEAVAALRDYGDRLLLHRSSGAGAGAGTGLAEIRAVVAAAITRSRRRPLLIVDYLQKVPGLGPGFGPGLVPGSGAGLGPGSGSGLGSWPGRTTEDERIGEVVSGLKDIALEFDVPVLAVAAVDRVGLTAGRRLRVHHLQGPATLAYEPDVILILNEKVDVVARHHLMYDTRAVDRYREYLVLSIEKNRSGLAKIDLQLRKRLEQSRFERDLDLVPEDLVDERLNSDV